VSDNTEALANALRNARDEEIARLFVLVFGLAAERHPELLRTALSHVLDLKVAEEATKKIMGQLSEAHDKLAQHSAAIRNLGERYSKAAAYAKDLELRVATLKAANGRL
jgi:hypothetical protein